MAEEPDAEVFGPRKKYFKKWVSIPEYFRRTILNNLLRAHVGIDSNNVIEELAKNRKETLLWNSE